MDQVGVRDGRPDGRAGPVRVVLADDNAAVLEALHDLVAGDPAFAVVGTATDGEQALHLVAARRADILLTDRRMPLGGRRLVAAVRERHPHVAVVCLSADGGGRAEMLAAGAADYLVKGRSSDNVLAALHRQVRPGPTGCATSG